MKHKKLQKKTTDGGNGGDDKEEDCESRDSFTSENESESRTDDKQSADSTPGEPLNLSRKSAQSSSVFKPYLDIETDNDEEIDVVDSDGESNTWLSRDMTYIYRYSWNLIMMLYLCCLKSHMKICI